MRTIDADNYCENICLSNKQHCNKNLCPLHRAPTIDAEPVRHGHWIEKLIPTGVCAFGVDEMTCQEEECSVCHKLYWVGEKKNFCPNCGADMREVEE